MSDTIKFAILGCGHIGKRHAELVKGHLEAKLVAIIDLKDAVSLQTVELNVPHFSTLDDFLIAGIAVDVINICTPNGLHASQAIKCLNHGINVVVEKPIALSIVEAKAISMAALANDKCVFPVVQNRYSPTVKWLKGIVSKGLLGEIFMVQLNCFWNRDDNYYTKGSWHGTLSLDGGPLYTQFSHFIDVLYWVFGNITNIETKFANFNHQHSTEFEDSGIITFDLVNGGIGSINYSTSAYQSNFESSITVIAKNGTVKIGGQYMNTLEYCHVKGAEQPVLDTGEIFNDYGSYKGSASNHHRIINNVVKTLKGLEQADVSLQEGVNVAEIISNIYQNRSINKVILEKI